MRTDERVMDDVFLSREEYLIYLRHLSVYKFAQKYIPAGNFVLEIGCGLGYGTKLLSENVKKIIGLDIDKNIINSVSKKHGSEKCLFELYDGHNIPYPDKAFDTVISFQVIEHIENDKGMIKEMSRVLKDKGILIIATPNRVFRFIKTGQKPSNKFHVREYSAFEFKNLLQNKFLDVNIFGIRGRGDVQDIEKNNVKLGLKITALDPFDLRRILPESVKQAVSYIIKKITWRGQAPKSDKNFINIYSTKDYFIIENDIDRDSVDLIAICKKS